MKAYLEKLIVKTEKEQAQNFAKFTSDIVHQFSWCAEDVFKLAYKIHFIKVYIIPVVEHYSGMPNDEILKEVQKYLTETVLSSDRLMERSSNQMHSYTALWSKEVIVSLINTFKSDRYDIKESE